VLYVSYNDLVEQPEGNAERVSEFLGGRVNVKRMAETVDSTLYRKRKTPSDDSSDPLSKSAL
jgi:Sulfotransferase domain